MTILRDSKRCGWYVEKEKNLVYLLVKTSSPANPCIKNYRAWEAKACKIRTFCTLFAFTFSCYKLVKFFIEGTDNYELNIINTSKNKTPINRNIETESNTQGL